MLGVAAVTEMATEQELLATLSRACSGLGLPIYHSGLEYAASVLYGCGVMRGRSIELRVDSVAEAQALVQRGIDNLSLLPADDYESWTVAEMKGLQSRFLEREHLARLEPLVTRLLANPSPQNSTWLSRLLENACPLSCMRGCRRCRGGRVRRWTVRRCCWVSERACSSAHSQRVPLGRRADAGWR